MNDVVLKIKEEIGLAYEANISKSLIDRQINYPFITEDQVRKICLDNDLVLGPEFLFQEPIPGDVLMNAWNFKIPEEEDQVKLLECVRPRFDLQSGIHFAGADLASGGGMFGMMDDPFATDNMTYHFHAEVFDRDGKIVFFTMATDEVAMFFTGKVIHPPKPPKEKWSPKDQGCNSPLSTMAGCSMPAYLFTIDYLYNATTKDGADQYFFHSITTDHGINTVRSYSPFALDWIRDSRTRGIRNSVSIKGKFLNGIGNWITSLDGDKISKAVTRKIIAPSSKFQDMPGLRIRDEYSIQLDPGAWSLPMRDHPDPILLQPVKRGYRVLGQWDDESNIIKHSKMN